MITWMQKHRKYLVITLWISTFAFVGAGFVGWGQYNYNSDKNAAVAMVGDEKVTIKAYQKAYQNFFYYENERRKGTYTQEQATKDGLQAQVIDALINDALMRNYAKEIGITVLDKEIKNKMTSIKAFQKEGKFNKEQYYLVMKNSQQKAADFERSLENELLVTKLRDLINLPYTDLEVQMMYAATYMEDTVGIKTLSLDSAVVLDDTDIKAYWEIHKDDYMTAKTYAVSVVNVPLSTKNVEEEVLKTFFEEHKFDYKNTEGKLEKFEEAKEAVLKDYGFKIAKKEALKIYLSVKKGKVDAGKTETISDDNILYDMEKLSSASKGDVLKPMKTQSGYAVLSLNAINLPVQKSYEEAKDAVSTVVKMDKTQQELEGLAKKTLETEFNYDKKVVLSKDKMQVEGVNPFLAMQLVQKIFSSDGKGYVVTPESAIVFNILEQKLLPESYTTKKDEFVDNVAMTKANLLNNAFIETLRKKYTIEKF